MKNIVRAGLAVFAICTGSAFATLIPIGALPSSGNGLGAVNSVVTFQNTGTEVGCVGGGPGGSTVIGATKCAGGVSGAGGTNEQTGSGNNAYLASSLGIGATGSNTFANLVLVFNGNEGGNAADQPITLD